MPMTHRHRFARVAGPALVLATAGLLSLPGLAPAQAATAPTAVQILRSIGQQPHATVTRVHAEGPAVVVNDGFCTVLRSAGCQLAEHTKDATLVRFDTKTQKFETWTIPSGGGVVRNIDHTPDGNLWLACSGVNKIAFVEIPKATAKN